MRDLPETIILLHRSFIDRFDEILDSNGPVPGVSFASLDNVMLIEPSMATNNYLLRLEVDDYVVLFDDPMHWVVDEPELTKWLSELVGMLELEVE